MAPAEDDDDASSVLSATSSSPSAGSGGDDNDHEIADDAGANDAPDSAGIGGAARRLIGTRAKLVKRVLSLRDGLLVEDGGDGDGASSSAEAEEGYEVSASVVSEGEYDVLEVEAIREDDSNHDHDHGGDGGGGGGDPPAEAKRGFPLSDPRCTLSLYGGGDGEGTSADKARELIGPDADGGLVYHALLLPDDFDVDPSKVRVLPSKDYDAASGAPKPRRKSPFPLRSSEFFSSLTVTGRPDVEDQAESGYDELWDREVRSSATHSATLERLESEREGARWVFTGVLNGWPGLTCLELRSIEVEVKAIMGTKKSWKPIWRVDVEGADGVEPSSAYASKVGKKGDKRRVRAKLRAPKWSARGWSEDSPGFLYWVTGPTADDPTAGPVLTYGTNIKGLFKCPEEEDPQCERVTMVCHRYATGGKRDETAKEKLTYHSLALLEWDHRRYCTVVEIGWLNGIGGYRGKANWFDDKDEPGGTALYAALPPEMVLPWKSVMSEVRVYDVPFADLDGFKSYLAKYEGHSGRFVDVRYPFSHIVRLTYRSRRNVAAYLLNYIRRDRTYSEMRRNCQTFTADFCGFLAGKKDVQPFHPVNQLQYVNQKHKFLYESAKYKGG